MADDFIDRLRTASFPTARRGGYDTEAVDVYLRELADWLETGGDDQTRAALVQREMERVGARTGGILAAAQESADGIVSEAKAEAAEARTAADHDAAEARSLADSYALETRHAADEHVRLSAEAAAREASDLRTKAESEAQEKIGHADATLQQAEADAKARTARVEDEIAELVKTRESIVENLESLTSGIRGVVDGPGGQELVIPEGVKVRRVAEVEEESEPETDDEPDDIEPESEPHSADPELEPTQPFDPQSVQEHVLPTSPPPPAEGSDDTTVAIDNDPEKDDEARPPLPPPVVGNEDDTAMVDAFDTDEHEQARERELERRRNEGAHDPTTDERDESDPLL